MWAVKGRAGQGGGEAMLGWELKDGTWEVAMGVEVMAMATGIVVAAFFWKQKDWGRLWGKKNIRLDIVCLDVEEFSRR